MMWENVYQSEMCCEFSELSGTPCQSFTYPHLQMAGCPMSASATIIAMTIPAPMAMWVLVPRLCQLSRISSPYRLQSYLAPAKNTFMWRPAALLAVLLSSSAACSRQGAGTQSSPDGWRTSRMEMVDEQLRARGIRDPRVLDAMTRVPRHALVPAAGRDDAYGDHPLPIGHGQTISQPYIVAFMSEALRLEPTHRVLEIGTGSGYQAAVLGELAGEVYTIEIIAELAESARKTLL